jgi:hypothetical protein
MHRTKRLEYTRRLRSVPGRARNAAEAVMHLAHVTRERHRLEQERVSLERRMQTISARLAAIAGAETRLVPLIQPGPPPGRPRLPAVAAALGRMSSGVLEVTLQY